MLVAYTEAHHHPKTADKDIIGMHGASMEAAAQKHAVGGARTGQRYWNNELKNVRKSHSS